MFNTLACQRAQGLRAPTGRRVAQPTRLFVDDNYKELLPQPCFLLKKSCGTPGTSLQPAPQLIIRLGRRRRPPYSGQLGITFPLNLGAQRRYFRADIGALIVSGCRLSLVLWESGRNCRPPSG